MNASIQSLDIEEQIIRIDRAIAETRKLQDEAIRLRAEGQELYRARILAPVVAIAAFFGATLAILGPVLFRAALQYDP